ncbi:hypothetical protein O6R05_05510 [Peptoniphilus equinus]|uniref:Uncharacterized protein n=1 Tax=Peptoniphilus equinus TaxID=3016343 RepID=A0ABY7QTX4_9FIRM|nr:hypothetical protein [Peptoniphilus equinus]WBW49465.1 hypothetical protein O6R05_05510 [Peptoniphilus equinus]
MSVFDSILENPKADLKAFESNDDAKDTDVLMSALHAYYCRNQQAVTDFEAYFKCHRADTVWPLFIDRVLGLETFDESKLRGLSILLMRDGNTVEGVRFGIYLTKLYNLEPVQGAIRVMAELAVHDSFYTLAVDALKPLAIYPVIADYIHRKRESNL